jgi:hypothetical protein
MPLLSGQKKEYDTFRRKLFKSHIPPHHCFQCRCTNSIAEMMETKASSVTDMQKIGRKGVSALYQIPGVSLTDQGKLAAK